MKVTIAGYIVATQYSWQDAPKFDFYGFKPTGETDVVEVQPHTLEVDVSDSFDIRPGKVANLERERQKIRADFQARITEIEKQISELTAIGCEVAS